MSTQCVKSSAAAPKNVDVMFTLTERLCDDIRVIDSVKFKHDRVKCLHLFG